MQSEAQGAMFADMRDYLSTVKDPAPLFGHTKLYGEMWITYFADRTLDSIQTTATSIAGRYAQDSRASDATINVNSFP